jgi:hypothetical protein
VAGLESCPVRGSNNCIIVTDNRRDLLEEYAKAPRLLRTKPYTPNTNGKAERVVQTSLPEWAYARAYLTSDDKAQHLAEVASSIQMAPATSQPKV